YGVTPSQCIRLTQHFGSDTRKVLKEEPFRMAREIHGIGFKTADKIARNLGLPNDHQQRIEAGFLHVLADCEEEGHTRFPTTGLIEKAADLLELKEAPLLPVLREMVKRKDLLAKVDAPGEESFIQSVLLAKAEGSISKQVRSLLENPSALPPIKVEKAIEWAQARARFAFAPEQAEALKSALQNKISIITGGPGTGKTTILNALVAILKAKKVPLQLGAPTGRASRRLSASAHNHAQTIHRLLKFDAQTGGFTANESQPLKADFVIIDESSMLDTRLASALLRALSPKAHLVLVGDADQLPSVGPGQVFRDLMEHQEIPVIRLNSVFRQKSGNDIVNLAHQINQGQVHYPQKMETVSGFERSRDAFFLSTENPEKAGDWVVELVSRVLPKELGVQKLSDIQVLSPMHRGETGVGNLNQRLQEALNPSEPSLPYGSLNFRPGDRLLQTRNNYEKMVFNGDMGTVVSVDPSQRTLIASFEGQEHQYEKEELSELSLAYAISIHKSQGSEYPIVVIPILRQHYMMLQRNLIYTALTRAKSKAIFVGDPRAYAMAIRNATSHQRHTGLQPLLTP
ncbi:MAG: ATP-dependent RecD-like DNA helicase, partial [Opitutales bacterium]|nr:ATP-dependent RecD-like DNA helicase [Opitutales bacterium]